MTDDSKLVIYTTSWCADCDRAKYFLDEYGVVYVEHDVDSEPEAKGFVMRVNNGRCSVPTLLFPDGSILSEPSNQQLATKLNIDLNRTFA